jgi:hypothetical protein
MKKSFKNQAFSLAEALITLLIVCIIAIVSAPVITKKMKSRSTDAPWVTIDGKNLIYPTKFRDIKLGSSKKQVGIVVEGVLVFKNTKGEIIGWIAEDGSSSFQASCPVVNEETASGGLSLNDISQEDLDRMVKAVTDSMVRQNIDVQKGKTSGQKTRKPSQNVNVQDLSSQMQGGGAENIDMGALMQVLQNVQSQQN